MVIHNAHLSEEKFSSSDCSRIQFEDLLSHVGGQINLRDTNYRHYIPDAERLSICLRGLQDNSFWVGCSTVCSIVLQVVAAIWDCLVEEFMVVPSTENWRSIAEEFLHRWNFPLCCGQQPLVNAGYRFPVIDVWVMVGPVTAAFWPILPLVRLCVLAHFIYPLTSTCLELGHMVLPQPHVFVVDEALLLRMNMMPLMSVPQGASLTASPWPTLSSFCVSPKPTLSSFGVLTVEVVSSCR
ncbi:hypothetical protein CRENBAI_014847 [Crenichthys baileyi]|uniref:Uncharacterized protein n=1 Tax=Crenichthys baileyi TaxID=28760 RepID=A0AAV9SPL7_9TELE